MISKKVACKPENDDYKRLAKYIADASHKGEKCLYSWCAGTSFSDDVDAYGFGIQEVEDTQKMNKRTGKEKTYHLVVSFRMEDEEKLTLEDFKVIEEDFAKTLGLSEHQRHCGVHTNTNNLHLHIAYNLIHPTSYRRYEPFGDYYKRDKLCRKLEKKYNLSIDNGRDSTTNTLKVSAQSATKESLTGEESFERYLMDRHDKLMELIDKSKTWEDVHHAFALYGLEIKQRANGLAIKNHKGKQSIKASSFDKEISFNKMTERFGAYTPIKGNYKAKDWYKKKPLQTDFSNELWKEFVKESRMVEIENIKEKWYREKVRITGLAISRKNRFDLLKRAKLRESMEINQIRQAIPLENSNWIEFLKNKALNGNENALKILQKKQSSTIIENLKNNLPNEAINAEHYEKKLLNLKQNLEQTQIKENILSTDKSHKSKKILTAIALMQIATNEKFNYHLTRNGSIVFTFENGEKIIDEGKYVHHNDKGAEIVKSYKELKFHNKTKEKYLTNDKPTLSR